MKPYRLRSLTITESTNDDAKKSAEAGEPSGLVIWARQQTAGRGRLGRHWISPPGNLYSSLLLRPACDAKHVAHFTFVTSLAAYDVVKSALPDADVTLKWPNDVLVNRKKICGILLESSGLNEGKLNWLVIGMGLNVAHYPDDTAYPATSLMASGALAPDLSGLLETFWCRFFEWQIILNQQGFAAIREAWEARAQRGKLSHQSPTGYIEGTFAGLNEEGGLVLQLADGAKQAIAAGDVFTLP